MAMQIASLPSSRSVRKSLLRGFLHGIGAVGLFISGTQAGTKPSHGSLAGDWQAVGNDMRRATIKYGQKRA